MIELVTLAALDLVWVIEVKEVSDEDADPDVLEVAELL